MARSPSDQTRVDRTAVAQPVATREAAAPVTQQASTPRNTAVFQVGDIGSVCQRGKFFGAGELIELNQADAARLIRLGCVKAI